MLKKLKSRSLDQRGAVLVIVAICLPVFLGMGALAIDVGSFYQAERHAQSAADAAALAGIQDLPNAPATAISDATSYVSKNFPGATTTISQPTGSELKVIVNANTPSFLGHIFGVTSANVSATAVAAVVATGAHGAVFGYDSNCSDQGVTLNGNNLNVPGGIESNGTLFQNGNNGSFGPTTYGGPNACTVTANGNNNTYSSGPTPSSTSAPWPDDFRTNLPACTFTQPSFTFSTNNLTITSGVYCASGQISINANNLTCTGCTFIAGSFNLNGNSENFTPSADGLMIYQTGTGTLDINGNTYFGGGSIFVPNAPIVLNGNSGTATGYLEGLDVTVNGNNFTLNGSGPSTGGNGGSLIQ